MSRLFEPLRLPNGQVIPNRIAKAAMEENLADADHAPSPELIQLYRSWSRGGAGLIITGNVMVDRHALTGPGGVVLESDRHLPRFHDWAQACRSEEAAAVVQMLNPLAVDLIELSGGSYESPAMQGQTRDGSTLAREAYFLEFAVRIGAVANMPVMVTGGVRRKAIAEQALQGCVAMVGMATALAIDPQLPARWRRGEDAVVQPVVVSWKNKALAAGATQAVVKKQLVLLGKGRPTDPNISPLLALLGSQLTLRRQARRYRRWLTSLR